MLLKEEIDFILEISNFEKFKKMCQKENKLFSDLDENCKMQNAKCKMQNAKCNY